MGHYSALTGSQLPTFRNNLPVRLQGSTVCLILEGGTHRIYRNLIDNLSTPRNITEQQGSHLHLDRSFKSYKTLALLSSKHFLCRTSLPIFKVIEGTGQEFYAVSIFYDISFRHRLECGSSVRLECSSVVHSDSYMWGVKDSSRLVAVEP